MAFESASPQIPAAPGDALGPFLSSASFEFLLIELVPMSYRTTSELASKEDEWLVHKRNSGIGGPVSAARSATVVGGAASLGVGGIGGSVAGLDEDETREAVGYKLDAIGYRVGLSIVEKYAPIIGGRSGERS
jgi:hypothetical protein